MPFLGTTLNLRHSALPAAGVVGTVIKCGNRDKERKVAVPRFSYELAPPRKDRYVVSVILHIAGIIFLWQIGPLLPAPRMVTPQARVELLYAPAPELRPPSPTAKIAPPSPKLLAEFKPKLIAPAANLR